MSVLLKYIASSGNEYNLKGDGIKSKTANYHTWTWDFLETNLQYGTRVAGTRREAAVYSTLLYLYGSYAEKKALLDALHEDFERDLRTLTPGRIIWGDYYIECFIRESMTEPGTANIWANNELEFYCPYPFWIRELTNSFLPQQTQSGYEWLEYAFDYKYDYFPGSPGSASWQTKIPWASEFKMTIFGEAGNPRVSVNGHPYQVNVDLAANEYLIIDSRKNTVTKYLANGTTLNVFDKRNKAQSVFEPIPGGTLRLTWPGTFGFDLTLYEERSEPRCTI